MEIKKNDKFTVTIEDMGEDGAGIGRVDGYIWFVKDALIGDTIEASAMKMKKNYGFARLVRVITPAKGRVEAKCPVARACGGCQLQAMSYESQLKFKENKVYNNLRRIGGFTDIPFLPIMGMDEPWRYRNKAQFPFGRNKNGEIVTGFYAGRTHDIIPQEDCLLGVEENKKILESIKEYMIENHVAPYEEETHQGLIRHALIRKGFKTGELMVCVIINGKKLPHSEKLVEKLCRFDGMTSISYSINTDKTNVILGKELVNLYGPGYITDYIGDVKYRISPLSFYQVNPVQTEKLYGKAMELAELTGKETVLDAYCGIGTIGLIASKHAGKVIGVELNQDAVRDAVQNAKKNGITNAQFFCNDAGRFMSHMAARGESADVVFMDPPRSGSTEEFIDAVALMQPKRVVYISCGPDTLARDLKVFAKHGYRAKEAWPVDLFGWTEHVETVCLLSHKAPV